jgi:fucose permease
VRRPALLVLSLAFLAFFALGLPDTVLGVAWPSLRAAFGVSQAGLGAVLVAGVAGYFASGLVAGRLIQLLGVGGLLTASTGLVALGLVGYATAPAFGYFLPVATVIGLGSGAIDTALNDYGARHFPVGHLNWLHASWCVGATLGPLVMTGVLAADLPYRVGYALLAAGLGAMTVAFAATRRSWQDGSAGASIRRAGAWSALRRGRVWLQIVIFFVYTGLESSTGQWCFTVLREARGLGVEAAGAWTAAYWGSLLVGRVVLGFVIGRVGPDRLLRAATLTAVVGAIAFAASAGLPGRIGLVLLGASLAPIYPTLMARTPGRLGPDATPHAIGFQVSAATLGTAVLPGAVGLWVAPAGAQVVPPAVAGIALAVLALHEVLLRATRR